MFNWCRLCRKDEISFNNVAETGNNVEATVDIVERIVSVCSIRQCYFDIVADMDGA